MQFTRTPLGAHSVPQSLAAAARCARAARLAVAAARVATPPRSIPP
jgi:hypothetical protein